MLPSSLSSPVRLPGLIAIVTGAILTLAAAVFFFAWNWNAMPVAGRFALAAAGTTLCLGLAFAAERTRARPLAPLALLAAALFTGLVWVVFGQVFQSGATAPEFCLVWAAGILPIFLLRREALLWNLLILLLIAASCTEPLIEQWHGSHTSHLLPPLLTAFAGCLVALLPPRLLRRSPGLNAWLLLPLSAMLALASAMVSLCILFLPMQYAPSLPELVAGPAVFATVLAAAAKQRHLPSLCLLGLSALVLLNFALARLFDHLPLRDMTAIFALVNLACAFALSKALKAVLKRSNSPRLLKALSHVPALLGGALSALSLMGFTLLVINENGSFAALLYAGLAYMPCGVLLWRLRGKSTFLSVLASVLVTGGSLCFHLGLLDYPRGTIVLSVWAAALLLYLMLDYPPLRFSAVFWALVSTLVLLSWSSFPDMVLPVSAFLLCLLPLTAAAAGRFPQRFMRPAAFACLCVLPLLCPSFPSLSPLRIDLGSAEEKIALSLAAANLIALLLRCLPPSDSPAYPRRSERAAAIFILFALWMLSPLEHLVALNMLVAGIARRKKTERLTCDRTLMALGLVVLLVSLFFVYYLTDLTFRTKMLAIGVPGLCLLFSGLWMEYRARRLAAPETSAADLCPPLFRHALSFALCAAALSVLIGAAAADRAAILHDGRDVLLALTPRDPRAFMLGDYMALSYDIDRLISPAAGAGCLPLAVDEAGRGLAVKDAFVEGGDCAALAVPALRVEQNVAGNARLRLPRRFYFEEGRARDYADAAFAVLCFDGANRVLLRGLADAEGRLLPSRDDARP